MKEKFIDLYNEFLVFHQSYLEGYIFFLKIFAFSLSVFLVLFIIIILFKIRKGIKEELLSIAESVVDPGIPKKELDEKWQRIMRRLEKESESDFKMAVIEADNLFDDLLKKIGYQGDDMGERLKQITKAQLANIDELWDAHKMRNRIAHEPDFKLTKFQAERAVEIYQKAMEDLEAI